MERNVGLIGARPARSAVKLPARRSPQMQRLVAGVAGGDSALYGATGGGSGLVVIAGTGSICCGVNSRRKRVCAGGWGPIAGDEGGGSWIARKALQAVAQAADERGPKTALTIAACDYFPVSSPDELSTAMYATTMSNDHLAALGKLI